MSGIKSINLAVAFLLEICLLVIFAYLGITLSNLLYLKIILGGGFPLLLLLIWSKYLAPASRTRLKEPGLIIAKGVIFLLAVLALISISMPYLAVGFAIISMINLTLLYIWRQ